MRAAVMFVFLFAFLALAYAQIQHAQPLQSSLLADRQWAIEDNDSNFGHPTIEHQLPTHRPSHYHLHPLHNVAELHANVDALSGSSFIDEPSAVNSVFQTQQIFPNLYALEAAMEYLSSMPEVLSEPADVSFTYTRSSPQTAHYQHEQHHSHPVITPLSSSELQRNYESATSTFIPQPVRAPSFSSPLFPAAEHASTPPSAATKTSKDRRIEHPTPLLNEPPATPSPSPPSGTSPTVVLKLHPVLHLPSNENHVHITINQTELEGQHINIIHPHAAATKKQYATTPPPVPSPTTVPPPPVTEQTTTPTPMSTSTAAPETETTIPPSTSLPPTTPPQPMPDTPTPTPTPSQPPSTPPANLPPSQETTTPQAQPQTFPPAPPAHTLPYAKQPRPTTSYPKPTVNMPSTPPLTRLSIQPLRTKVHH